MKEKYRLKPVVFFIAHQSLSVIELILFVFWHFAHFLHRWWYHFGRYLRSWCFLPWQCVRHLWTFFSSFADPSIINLVLNPHEHRLLLFSFWIQSNCLSISHKLFSFLKRFIIADLSMNFQLFKWNNVYSVSIKTLDTTSDILGLFLNFYLCILVIQILPWLEVIIVFLCRYTFYEILFGCKCVLSLTKSIIGELFTGLFISRVNCVSIMLDIVVKKSLIFFNTFKSFLSWV